MPERRRFDAKGGTVRGLRIVGRGLRDTYESLFTFCLASVGWWLATLPAWLLWPVLSWLALLGFLAFGPAATIALFAIADPRRAVSRPDLGEMLSLWRTNLVAGWKLAAVTLPVPLVLLNNILVFGGSDDSLAALAPLWAVLLVVSLCFLLVAFASGGMFLSPLGDTLRRTAYVLLAAPFRSLFVLAAVVVYLVIGTGLVVPMILFVPALVAATVDRLVAQALNLTIIDPNAPTEERTLEKREGRPQKGRLRDRR
jgi:hypothetical protein